MRDFLAALPREGRWLLATVAIQLLGRGMTLPFTIIYLHEVRGFDLGLAGTLMGLIAIVGFVVTGLHIQTCVPRSDRRHLPSMYLRLILRIRCWTHLLHVGGFGWVE